MLEKLHHERFASARAAMQLRKSPGGSIPCSRSIPEEPPSSAMVTIAVMLLE
jgi:hypothetical protein